MEIMPRYIDADLLCEKMYHKAFEEDSSDQKWDSGCWIRYHMFEDAIESIPTADVVERDHEITYMDCAKAMMKMWIDKVLTDGEYNRIMDRLNAQMEEITGKAGEKEKRI